MSDFRLILNKQREIAQRIAVITAQDPIPEDDQSEVFDLAAHLAELTLNIYDHLEKKA